MRSKFGSTLLLAAGLSCCSGVLARGEGLLESPQVVMTRLPSCAVPCFISAIEASECLSTDSQCICSSSSIDEDASRCVHTSCAFLDALSTKNITSTACHAPVRDRSDLYNAVAIALGSISIAFITIRVIFKQFFSTTRSLDWDDWVVIGMIPTRVASTVLNSKGMVAFGLGRDVWAIPPGFIPSFAAVFYAMEIIYFAEVSLIKLSLCFFYLRIFPSQNIRRVLWVTVGFNVLTGLLFVLLAAFHCMPVSHAWKQYEATPSSGQCINNNALAWANAIISIVADFWVIAIPFSQMKKLPQLSWQKKLGVGIMFSTGAFITVVSIIRLQALITFANSKNPTWDQWETAYWSTIEVNTGVICICLPTMRLILSRVVPGYLSSMRRSKHSYEESDDGSEKILATDC